MKIIQPFITVAILLCSTACKKISSPYSVDTQKYLEKEAKYQYTAYRFFGQEVAKQLPDAKILLIKEKDKTDNTGKFNNITTAQMNGLKDGLGNNTAIQQIHNISIPQTKGAYTDLYQHFNSKVLDNLLSQYEDYDTIILMVDLPSDFKDSKLFKESSEDTPTLCLTQTSNINALLPYLQGQKPHIKVALTGSGKRYDWKAPYPDVDQIAFEQRWILVTPDNVNDVINANPKRFGIKK